MGNIGKIVKMINKKGNGITSDIIKKLKINRKRGKMNYKKYLRKRLYYIK